ncbi:MAG: 2-hydroxyacyl-CoA dehydratase [Chloroflexi bacterium]|nr:2-hydroxyacyl-CoA dehydratase [Chloroflexota bacterium]MBM3172315.1 2-hydroxyacyl-CoA dehydratase [Chloroflexota bacterium]MBM3174683.1 2-hydroxyacyl-CoA dehydratase [Chloroflexota bacterium]MBM4450093.1 2-hydroxyacyl-CoA dehydratase [Chloroflexota bacterium]
MVEKSKGLSKAAEIYGDRPRRAKELKAQGKKIVGYPCVYVPLEMLTALDLVPYRTYANINESVTEADRALPASFCPIMRSCLDCALKGKEDFFDGFIAAHSCDPQEKTMRVWESYVNYGYFHFLDIPGSVRSEVYGYFKGQLNDLKKTLEGFAGKKLADDKLKAAIKIHNQQRALVNQLYELTKPIPPLISGIELVQVIKAVLSIPVAEGNELLADVIAEVKARGSGPEKKLARLMVWGSSLDEVEVMRLLEAKANVVLNESCGGIRPFRGQVKPDGDLIDNLAHYYLEEITCARTFRQAKLGETHKDYAKDIQSRFGYLKSLTRDWKVNGAILLLVRYCDPFAFEMPAMKDYLESIGIPSTYIEYDHTMGSLAPLRTRVEAFLETIS